MAERTRKQQERASARERRRSMTAQPFERLHDAATSEAGDRDASGREHRPDARSALKSAAATALAGALAAGLAGAAKGLRDRRNDDQPDPAQREGGPEPDEPRAERQAGEAPEEPEARAPERQEEPEPGLPQPNEGEEAEPRASEPEAEEPERDEEPEPQLSEPNERDEAEPWASQSEADQPDARGPEREEEPQLSQPSERDEAEPREPEPERAGSAEDRADDQPAEEPAQPQADGGQKRGPRDDHPSGASSGDVKDVVGRARRELQDLLGSEPETVSGFERRDGRWVVTLEVVDVRRVPDSTDVLASYEVVLDDDQNLVSFTQRRRYRRSQIEESG